MSNDSAPTFHAPTPASGPQWAAAAPGPRSFYDRLPRGNEMLGLIYGIVVAAMIGVAWYLVVITTDRQFVYLAIAMGAAVGKAVSFGSGRSRVLNAAFSVVIATVGMFGAYYFIDRQLLIRELGAAAHVPMWHSFLFARELVSAGFDANPSGRIFTLIAAVLAGIVAYKETSSRIAGCLT